MVNGNLRIKGSVGLGVEKYFFFVNYAELK